MINNLLSIISAALLISACDKVQLEEKKNSDLELVKKYTIDVPEPSGLAFAADGKNLWTVSDNTGHVYLISPGGEILKELKFEGKDLEGISLTAENEIAVVRERSGEIIKIDADGNEISSVKLEQDQVKKLSPEGITFNKNNNHYYVLNEKKPTIIFELDENFRVVNSKKVDFAEDISGITYEQNENAFWIVSHESSLLIKCDEQLNMIESFEIPLKQAEGVAVDFSNRLIYMVSDADNELSIFKLK